PELVCGRDDGIDHVICSSVPTSGSLAAAAPAVAAPSAGPAGACPDFLVARLCRFVKLLRAVCLRRDRRELSGAALGEGGVVFLQVLDQMQAGHAVVDAPADRLPGA